MLIVGLVIKRLSLQKLISYKIMNQLSWQEALEKLKEGNK